MAPLRVAMLAPISWRLIFLVSVPVGIVDVTSGRSHQAQLWKGSERRLGRFAPALFPVAAELSPEQRTLLRLGHEDPIAAHYQDEIARERGKVFWSVVKT